MMIIMYYFIYSVRVMQYDPTGSSTSPWSDWRTNPDHICKTVNIYYFTIF